MAASSGRTAFLSSMKSPRWLSSSSPIGVSRLIGSLAILRTLRTFSSGMPSFSASSSGLRLAADLVQHLAGGAHQLVDGLDHVHRDADGARLVGDRAGDGLPDPPCRIGRELVAAAVLELVDRLHQADVALLDEVQELQAAVRVLLGDGDHEAQVGLDHLLLGPHHLALAVLHGACTCGGTRRSAGAAAVGDVLDVLAQIFSIVGALCLVAKSFQPLPDSLADLRRASVGSISCVR